uniref:Uncharacterized protein n=1 Tax=Glossina pallidipes TaxID=7398 RepID=A0A1B0ACP3_GLOPL
MIQYLKLKPLSIKQYTYSTQQNICTIIITVANTIYIIVIGIFGSLSTTFADALKYMTNVYYMSYAPQQLMCAMYTAGLAGHISAFSPSDYTYTHPESTHQCFNSVSYHIESQCAVEKTSQEI